MSLQDDFIARFPEFSPLNQLIFDGVVATYPCLYGCEYGATDCDDNIILYLCAHLYAIDLNMSNSSGPVNSVSSKSVGDESISYNYGDMSNQDLFFSTTRYGQRYLMLIQKNMGVQFA